MSNWLYNNSTFAKIKETIKGMIYCFTFIFERLNFIKTETAIKDMGNLSNPKRIYINSIMKSEEEEIKRNSVER